MAICPARVAALVVRVRAAMSRAGTSVASATRLVTKATVSRSRRKSWDGPQRSSCVDTLISHPSRPWALLARPSRQSVSDYGCEDKIPIQCRAIGKLSRHGSVLSTRDRANPAEHEGDWEVERRSGGADAAVHVALDAAKGRRSHSSDMWAAPRQARL